MNDQDSITEQDLDDYLAGKDTLSDVYQQSKEIKAPEHLDFQIRQQARAGLLDAGHLAGTQATSRALRGSIAAVILLGVLVGLLLQSGPSQSPTPLAQQTLATQPSAQNDTAPAKTQQLADAVPDSLDGSALQLLAQDTQQAAPPLPQPEDDRANKPVPDAKELPRLALVQTPEATQATAQTKTRSSTPAQPTNDVRKAPAPIPDELKTLLQPAGVQQQTAFELPPAEILKKWTRQQWIDQVTVLREQHNERLAQRYIQRYSELHSGQSLLDDLK